MNKQLRFGLLLLLLPAMAAALYIESRLTVSPGIHMVLQIMVVLGVSWLVLRWVIYDEISSLREIHQRGLARYHNQPASSMEDAGVTQRALAFPRLSGAAKAAGARTAGALMSAGIVFALSGVMLSIGLRALGGGVLSILYLLPIGWCTVRWGRLAGVSAAVTAALSFDFLFIPPYGTFNIGSLEGWSLLFLFIATAIFVVGRAQSILDEERERGRKATFLFEVAAAISDQVTSEGIALAIADQFRHYFLVESVQIHLAGGLGHARAAGGQASAPARKLDRAFPIVYGSETIGEIVIWQGSVPLPADDDPMLQTMLRQLAAALNRIRTAERKPSYPNQRPAYSDGNSFQVSHS